MTILCYHAVEADWASPLAVNPSAFTRHMEWISRHRTVLPLEEAVRRLDSRGRLPRGMTAITFDDGFRSVCTQAAPILQRFSLPATVFVVAETLTRDGRAVDWVDTPPAHPLQTMDLPSLREIQAGGIAIGSHSYAHADLTSLDLSACEVDLLQSRELLQDLLGGPVPFLAYPRGRHNAAVRQAARGAGYSHAFSLPERSEPSDAFAVPRVGVFPGNDPGALRIKTEPAYLSIRTSPVFPALKAIMKSVPRAGAASSHRVSA